MKLKLQGFELEIEGNREDASVIGKSIGDQISGMLSPSLNIVEGEYTASQSKAAPPPLPLFDEARKRKIPRRPRSPSAATESNGANAIDFRNDPAKFATPTQQWSTADKAVWLLYVVKEVSQASELSTGQIVKIFNTHFRQAKTITSSNVSRDLGRLKITSPSLVGEDPTKTPAVWFLTDEGIRKAQTLIAEAKAPATA
ncbi:hypothetical protein [Bradyrhizobium sp. Ce-3]|uniref:hypothetical protein n=1 Tax=Bradyrhizobium sp. Ce-3 TaxID=2913970 RepID=UPI001FB9D060|nr:hypothetical protein [Bradyrhizobium sp. Ce-3]GKQ51117.1 hypothetical protein BRSPCE3_19720 [Bradyrhizobium sp. Ce-3]